MANFCPCKNCEERHDSCHSHCREYIIWSKERQEKLYQAQRDQNVRNYIYDTAAKRRRKKNDRRK